MLVRPSLVVSLALLALPAQTQTCHHNTCVRGSSLQEAFALDVPTVSSGDLARLRSNAQLSRGRMLLQMGSSTEALVGGGKVAPKLHGLKTLRKGLKVDNDENLIAVSSVSVDHRMAATAPTKQGMPKAGLLFELPWTTAVALMFLGILFLALLIWIWSAPVLNPNVAEHDPLQVTKLLTDSQKEATSEPASRAVPEKKKTMDALDGLRVVFICLVISHHIGVPEICRRWVWLAHSSMSFFCFLSGFIRVYTVKEKEGYSWAKYKVFVAQLLARFAPAYWLALICLCGLSQLLPEQQPPLAWPMNALFLQSLFPLNAPGVLANYFPYAGNYVAWFTSVVVLCSLCFPLLYNMRPSSTLVTLLALVFLICLRIVVLREFDGSVVGPLRLGDRNFWSRLPEFWAGMLLGQLCSDRTFSSILSWGGWGWIFDGVLVLIILLSFQMQRKASPFAAMVFVSLMPLLLFSARGAVENSSTGAPSSGILGRLLAWQPLVSAARYSFGAYIFQAIPQRIVHHLIRGKSPEERTLMEVWASFVLTWLMGVASEHLLEKHVRKVVETRSKGPVAVSKEKACID
mmetsp:Transcript_122923/g.223377  ORF Transcript_122923/g.223377 Transcript_122923/m.223377 type:complete len:573 (-) Transcript_122923:217-1935(-)